MPIYRGHTSRGVHVRAIAEALRCLIEDLPDVPSERRVRLRTCLSALVRTYAGELTVNEVSLEQDLAEEDGHAVEP